MVVVFTYIFVIPYRVSREKLFTQCLVTAFFRLHQSDHQNCTLLVDNWSRDSTNDKSYCVGVKVMYKRLDTTWHYGVVSLGESESNLIEVKNSSFVPVSMPKKSNTFAFCYVWCVVPKLYTTYTTTKNISFMLCCACKMILIPRFQCIQESVK